MDNGELIELYLVNGTYDSLVIAELANWNGKALKIPRAEISSCSREDIREVGVYFLFCNDDPDGTLSVYIGEAENIHERLMQHIRDYKAGKELFYWNNAVAFLGKDLNKASIRYLENKLVSIARTNGNYKVLTKNTYQNTVIKESIKATLDKFIENLKLILTALGYKALTSAPIEQNNTTYFYCKRAGANGKGFVSNGGFTVLKDSMVSDKTVPSMETYGKSYYALRCQLQELGVIQNNVFTRDYEFSAPSAASSVLLGRTSNGNNEWLTESGLKLKDIDI
ncbi:putative uncharacterized protein [Firmicutes bacterium CAG:552]|nr:putative uncharacterized protein [Firmicutes bacterium CAG:552]